MTTRAQIFTTRAQPITTPYDADITNFILEQRKDGRASDTIRTRVQFLKQMARTCNINDPEQVKTYIANADWNNKTKTKNADSYTAYARFKKLQWTPPKYMNVTKLPFIPTEQEIDLLISATGKMTSTVLQCLKETGIRIDELTHLKWTDLDVERKTLSITPAKGSNPRILPVSDKLIGMINSLPKNRPTIFQPHKDSLRDYLCTQRAKLADKLNNPRLRQIGFHTLRHYKGTMEYHKTKDIMHVKSVLGHKAITSTMIYINLESALFLTQNDEWTCKVAHTLDEATKLIENNFDYVTEMDNVKIFRKRK